jgi:hypothetical protein
MTASDLTRRRGDEGEADPEEEEEASGTEEEEEEEEEEEAESLDSLPPPEPFSKAAWDVLEAGAYNRPRYCF